MSLFDIFRNKKKAEPSIPAPKDEYDDFWGDEEEETNHPRYDWYCDWCEAYLNDQEGFEEGGEWQCTVCGCQNNCNFETAQIIWPGIDISDDEDDEEDDDHGAWRSGLNDFDGSDDEDDD